MISFEAKVLFLSIKERKDKENVLIRNLEDKTNNISRDINDAHRRRIVELNQTE